MVHDDDLNLDDFHLDGSERYFSELDPLPWPEVPFVVIDTETSGAYPMSAELCEVAAIRVKGGKIEGEYSSLIRPTQIMSEKIIGIHGITNEMVADAPDAAQIIPKFHDFIQGAVVLAHHAPFDVGFLAWEFEKLGLELPQEPALCTSLLSRQLIKESPNHKLQTLIGVLNLDRGQAHRALDDARACWGVAQICFQRAAKDAQSVANLERLREVQIKEIQWELYSLEALRANPRLQAVIEATERQLEVEIVYGGGTYPGVERRLRPEGIVRNPDGDYLVAWCPIDQRSKRFYLPKVKSSRLVEVL
jgi:DNA polymerase-3 subunit epsilon